MTAVWKFILPAPNDQGVSVVSMPEFAETLSVAIQGAEMVIWALVDTTDDQVDRKFYVFNTGAAISWIPAQTRFVGTVTDVNGIVWHVWATA